jgi:hypothetical protein
LKIILDTWNDFISHNKDWKKKIGIGTVQFGPDYGISNPKGKLP